MRDRRTLSPGHDEIGAMSEAKQEATHLGKSFLGERLRMARELKPMSQAALAAGIVSPAAVSQYERGAAVPNRQILRQFADRLKVDVDFFLVGEDTGFDVPAYFRSLRSAPAAELKRARHNVQLVHQVARELEEEVRLPPLDVPRLPIGTSDPDEAPEEAAEEVRRGWALPPGPVDNVVRVLERRGIVVARLASGHEKIDAFSVPFEDRPVVMMSAAKGKRDRSRFDVSHELGHLVMHDPGQRATKSAESQAQRFAAAFLMPRDEIYGQLPSTPDWELLIQLKRYWQVSIASLLYRAKTLGKMRPDVYVQAMKALSARGWRRHEPADLGDPESPVLLNRAIDVAGMSPAELAGRTAMPLPLLRDILDLAADDRPEVVL